MKHLCSTCHKSALSHGCTDRIFRNQGNIDGYRADDGNVVACPEFSENIPGWTPTPKGKIAREMWAILKPDGEIVIGTDFHSEEDAWRIATGWGDTEEIEQRKLDGWRAVRAVVMVAQ